MGGGANARCAIAYRHFDVPQGIARSCRDQQFRETTCLRSFRRAAASVAVVDVRLRFFCDEIGSTPNFLALVARALY